MFSNPQLIFRLNNAFDMAAHPLKAHRLKGENQLQSLQQDITYPLLLFNYIQSQEVSPENILRGAIALKNWFKTYPVPSFNQHLQQFTVDQMTIVIGEIKQNILGFYLNSVKHISLQIEQTLEYLIKREYPGKWQNLFTILVNQATNEQRIIRILKVIKNTSKRYSYEFRSDELYTQIIVTCNTTHSFLYLLSQNISTAQPKILSLLLKCFYNLNFQDLHPLFEQNINHWMSILINVMRMNDKLENKALDFKVFKCKGQALKSILLYAGKYREQVMDLINHFSNQIWQLCHNATYQQKYDKIFQNALKYFRNIVLWSEMKQFFNQNLLNLIKSLIIPNLGINQRMMTMIKEQPQMSIEHLFQKTDVSSRRFSAAQLLKTLNKSYSSMTNFYVDTLNGLQQNDKDTIHEICLLNMMVDGLTVCFRVQDGASELALSVDLVMMGYKFVKRFLFKIYQMLDTKLVQEVINPQLPIFYFRFIFFFRIYLPKVELQTMLDISLAFLYTKSIALRNSLLLTIKAIITTKVGDYKTYSNFVYLFNSESVELQKIFQPLFTSLCQSQTPQKYYQLLLFSMVKVLKQSSANYCAQFTQIYKLMLQHIEKGYDFDNILSIFEGLGWLVYYILVAKKGMSLIQSQIIPYFNRMFQSRSDLLNFVLQIYALVVQGSTDFESNQYFHTLFSSLLNMENWTQESGSLFLAYSVYIQSYLKRKPQILNQQRTKIQAIMIRLAQIGNDKAFFNNAKFLLSIDFNCIVVIIDNAWKMYEAMGHHHQQQTSSKKKHIKLSINKNLLLFVCWLLVSYPIQNLIPQFQSMKPGFLLSLIQRQSNIIRTIQNRKERKIVIIGLTNLLFKGWQFLNQGQWIFILSQIIDNYLNRKNFLRFSNSQNINIDNLSFKKLAVFGQVRSTNQEKEIKQDQQEYFISSFNLMYPKIRIAKSNIIQTKLSTQKQQALTHLLTP